MSAVSNLQVAGVAWTGGGCDLTPNYLTACPNNAATSDETDEQAGISLHQDIADFHQHWAELCGRFGPDLYQEYKAWCDRCATSLLWQQDSIPVVLRNTSVAVSAMHDRDAVTMFFSLCTNSINLVLPFLLVIRNVCRYFYVPCRKEHRGTGGIFFDDLPADSDVFDAMAFTRAVGNGLLPSWLPIAQRRHALPFSQQQREWQELRRGRYVEFNLLYDRGVKVRHMSAA